MGLTIKANPNATNSEFDAKTIIHHQEEYDPQYDVSMGNSLEPWFQYEKEQHRRACEMEEDYVEPT